MLSLWVVEFYHIDIQYIRDMQNLVFQKQSTCPCAPLCIIIERFSSHLIG